jgi:branched-chain amino acid transport system permease protein
VTAQFLVDGLMAGALIGLGAIGVTLTYSILGFANFAHGEFIAFGAYATLVIASAIGVFVAGSDQSIGPLSISWAVIAASLGAMALTGAMALALDFVLFRRLRGRTAAISLVMASFGASMAIRASLEFAFTSRPTYFSRDLQIATPIGLGLRITPDQIALLIVTAIVLFATHALLTRTQVGRAMRAVAENPALASMSMRRFGSSGCSAPPWRAPRGSCSVFSCKSARSWGSTCCCLCSQPPFSVASAACPARFSAR